MPTPTKSSAWGATATPPPEESTPSSQEELSSSDQEPDPKSQFNLLDSPNQFQACLCYTLKVPRWTGLSMMVFIIDFQSGA